MLNRYLDLGWPVIPLLPGDVRPPFPWREFVERPPGEREWKLWREIFPIPPYGIGLLTGRPSGIVVIDIDDPQVAEWFQTEIPFETLLVKTRRGFHFYFRTNGDVPTTKVEITEIGPLEVKGTGVFGSSPTEQAPEGPWF